MCVSDNERAVLAQATRNAEDGVRRTGMATPVNGIVRSLHVTAISQMIQPGLSAVEIVA
jgi:hypothetical protein